MTEELLERMNTLNEEIGELKNSLRRIAEVEKEGTQIESVEFSNKSIDLPEEIAEEIILLIKIKLELILKKKCEEFENGGLESSSDYRKPIPRKARRTKKSIDEFDDDWDV